MSRPRWVCCLVLLSLMHVGCQLPFPRWPRREQAVLSPQASKDEIVTHLNRNILGNGSQGGLISWQTNDGRASMPGIPLSMTTAIAVSAPRSFRLRIAHPVSGNQEADIGSNPDVFWMWVNTPDASPVMLARHEDVPLAMQELDLAIPMEPEWLMEVFGVIPIDAREYELRRPDPAGRVVELTAQRTSPLNETVVRVIRVNTFTGQIVEHQLRNQVGKVIARAELDNYRLVGSGISLPHMIRLGWPSANKEIRLELGHPEVNPDALASNEGLWQPPQMQGSPIVDIGRYAREIRGLPLDGSIEQVGGTGTVSLQPTLEGALLNPQPPAASQSEAFGASPWGEADRPSTPVPSKSAYRDPLEAPEPDPAVWATPVPAQPMYEYNPSPP